MFEQKPLFKVGDYVRIKEDLSPKELEEAPEEMNGLDRLLKYGRDDILDALYEDVKSGRLSEVGILLLTEILLEL